MVITPERSMTEMQQPDLLTAGNTESLREEWSRLFPLKIGPLRGVLVDWQSCRRYCSRKGFQLETMSQEVEIWLGSTASDDIRIHTGDSWEVEP